MKHTDYSKSEFYQASKQPPPPKLLSITAKMWLLNGVIYGTIAAATIWIWSEILDPFITTDAEAAQEKIEKEERITKYLKEKAALEALEASRPKSISEIQREMKIRERKQIQDAARKLQAVDNYFR
jgi:hypothetical protein